jgi:short-subunit dehydrogenase
MVSGRRTALVTGASAGIGEAFARALAANGIDLILTARRVDRLDALAAELRASHGVSATVIPANLAEPGAAAAIVGSIESQGLEVDWLINNAGYGVPGTFAQSDWTTHADFLRVMVEAPAELIWRLLPGMRTRNYGRIVNVASLAGHMPGPPGHTLYAPAKAFLIKMSESLAMEHRGAGVHVCALCPGFTFSEFHDTAGTRNLVEQLPKIFWQTAEAVVDEGIKAVEAGEAMRITGRVNRISKALVGLLPDSVALRLMAREARKFRQDKV